MSDDPQNPIRHTVCFYRCTGHAELGRMISAAFFGTVQGSQRPGGRSFLTTGQPTAVALWEIPPDEAGAGAQALVHPLSGVVANPELYTGRHFSLADRPQTQERVLCINVKAMLGLGPDARGVTEAEATQLLEKSRKRTDSSAKALELAVNAVIDASFRHDGDLAKAIEEMNADTTLLDVLRPLRPWPPARNPELLTALVLGAGALVSQEACPLEENVTAWVTTGSRLLALTLCCAIVCCQLYGAFWRQEQGRYLLNQLRSQSAVRHNQQRTGGALAVLLVLWILRVWEGIARLALVGVAHSIGAAVAVAQCLARAAPPSWCHAQLLRLAFTLQTMCSPLLEVFDYLFTQLYLHGPPSPIFSSALGFLDLPLTGGAVAVRVILYMSQPMSYSLILSCLVFVLAFV